MKYILAISFAFSSFIAAGQIEKSKRPKKNDITFYLEKVYDSLKKKGVSNYITIERSFYGMRVLDSLGGPSKYYDIFWQIDTITFFQQIKYYSDRIIQNPIRSINNSDIFTLLKTYYDIIRTEDFLPFIMKTESNGVESYIPLSPIHKANYDLFIYSKSEIIHKTFEYWDLQEKLGLEYRNLNYGYNNNTKLILLWNKLLEHINSY